MTSLEFEHKNSKSETRFETFLRYSNEKERSASKLTAILRQKLDQSSAVLDIGTGNGEYLRLALADIEPKTVRKIMLTLVEPSDNLVAHLKDRFAKLLPSHRLKIVNSDLQSFKSSGSFDVILMSHLFYHIPRASWRQEVSKAVSMLKSDGILILVLREKDEVYDFKMAFKPQMFDASLKPLVLDDVIETLPENEAFRIERQVSLSELHIPIETNMDDTVSIIEFYLNKEWVDIPEDIQQASLDFIKERGNVLKQVEGIAVISRKKLRTNE